MRQHFISIRMAIVRKKIKQNNKWCGCREIGNFMYCWQEVKWYSNYETILLFLKKLITE
jgi:hypothetical protein